MKNKDVLEYRELFLSRNKKLHLAKRILYGIATGEALFPQFYSRRQEAQALYGLRRYKFIRHTRKDDENFYSLTAKGKNRLRHIIIDEIKIKNSKKWDGEWWLVIYDLPIRFKKARDAFRFKLRDLGFFQFQKSAWIYPYPCEGEILLVANFFGVRKYIEILKVNKILDDKKIRDHFGL